MFSQNKNISKSKEKCWRFVGFVPAIIIFPVMFWVLADNLKVLFQQTLELQPWLLVASALLLIGHFIIGGLGWWLLLRFFGAELPLYQAVRISALALLGRYIPGKIWTVAGKIYMAHTKGVSNSISYISSIYEFILFNLGGIVVFFLMEMITPTAMVYSKVLIVTFLLLIIVFIGWPNSVTYFLNYTLRIVRQAPVDLSLRRWQLFGMLFYYSAGWLTTGLSFYLFVRGLMPGLLYSQLTGALVLATIVGFVVLLAPGGLGVREGVTAALLIMSGVTTDVAVFVSLCSRVWSTGGEILIVIPMYLFSGNKVAQEAGRAG